MKVQDNKVVYLDDADSVVYSLPSIVGAPNDIIQLNDEGELIFTDELSYTIFDSANWNVQHSLVNTALDELADRVKTLEETIVVMQAAIDALQP